MESAADDVKENLWPNRTDMDLQPAIKQAKQAAQTGQVAAPPAEQIVDQASPARISTEAKAQMLCHVGAPVPHDEDQRLCTVRDLNILDTPEDPVLNSICDLIKSLMKVPIAGISIVDETRSWFKAMEGVARFAAPRQLAPCGWVILGEHPEMLVVEDLAKDRRFSCSPLVLDPSPGTEAIRFYAGCPLVASNGHRLGSLCVLDTQPRKLDVEQLNVMSNFAELAVRHIEKDKRLHKQKQTNQSLLRSLNCFDEGMLLLDLGQSEWKILFANEAWKEMTGVEQSKVVNRPFWELFKPLRESKAFIEMRAAHSMPELASFNATIKYGEIELKLQFRPAGKDDLGDMPRVGVPAFADAPATPSKLYFAAVLPYGKAASASLDGGSAQSVVSNASEAQTERLQEGKGVLLKSKLPLQETFREVELGVLVKATTSGRIFRGQWKACQVAIKVLERHQKECIETGRNGGVWAPPEAILSTTLSHPHLVRGYKYAVCMHPAASSKGQPWMECWLVREWCSRGTLTDALLRGWLQSPKSRNADPNLVLYCTTQVVAALCCLHSADRVHGNLTGDSVWLTHVDKAPGFSIKLADYGAQAPSGDVPPSQYQRQRVTHAPPELLLKGKLSKAADIYAVGVLMYECSAQQRAWAGLSLKSVYDAVTAKRILLELPADLPTALKDIARACMAPRAADRPSAQQLLKQLQSMQDHAALHKISELQAKPRQTGSQHNDTAATNGIADKDRSGQKKLKGRRHLCNPFAYLRARWGQLWHTP